MNTGRDISEARKALGLSQGELARMADVDQGYLSLVESGKRTPSPRWLRDVNQALVKAFADRGAA